VVVDVLVQLQALEIHLLPTPEPLEVVREEGPGRAWQVCNVYV
jgi:hypothetical protein